MYVIVAASVDANRILVDKERLILAARCVFIFWVGIALALEVDEQDLAGYLVNNFFMHSLFKEFSP
jgi:hypothetical protein